MAKASKFGLYIGLFLALTLSACSEDAQLNTTSSTSYAAPTTAGEVVVNEIMPNPATVADASGGEWFELYNAGTDTFDLDGCEIYDANTDSHSISSELLIAPGETITLANGASPGFTPDYEYTSSDFTLDNTSDSIILACGGTDIDSVSTYDSTFSFSAGTSAELARTTLDDSSNDTGSNWCAGTVSYNGDLGTPGTANFCVLPPPALPPGQPAVAGEVIFSEIMPDPVTVADLSGGEWFELYNPSANTFNLLGCEIYDLNATPDSHFIYKDLLINPGQYITLANGATPGFVPTYGYPLSNITLANASDNLILDCGGTTIDAVSPYDGSFSFSPGASAELSSSLLDDTSNDTGSNWCTGASSYNGDLGTPNAANDCP